MLKGKAVSSGIGIGPAFLWLAAAPDVWEAGSQALADHEVDAEAQRLEVAVAVARVELHAVRNDAAARLGPEAAAIMDAHLLMLADPTLVGEAAERIRRERRDAPSVLTQVSEEMAQVLAALDDPYLRERAADVRDVTGRVVRHLTGRRGLEAVPAGAVLVAADLPPSELLRLPPGQLAAVVLQAGGATSHTAILARSMGIPAVMGVGAAVADISAGTTLLVDSDTGTVAIDPAPSLLAEYRQRMAALQQEQREMEELRHLPPETRDGRRVILAANIGLASEAGAARAGGAEGVGLFRTEFLFLDRPEPPSEDEQYRAYREALEAMAPHPVLIRTLDIGGDKPLPFLQVPPEENPFLGWRGIRLCQGFVPLFRTQLRAILRAAAHGLLQMMVPMVTTKREVLWVREQLASVQAELLAEGRSCGEPVELGIMIETPAAALMADELAPLVDFFSIGTNDLTQYTMAVDRLNSRIAGLYDPFHPAVLRLVRMVAAGAHRHGRWVGMCGELAGDPRITAVLLGLGLDELSMSAPQLSRVKRAIRTTEMAEATLLAQRALSLTDGDEVRLLLGVQ